MKKTNTDAPFFLLMGKIGDLVFANVLWLVCCIPVVTAGASTLGLFTVVNKLAAREDYTVRTDFFKAFKRDFKQSTALWLVVLLGGLAGFRGLQIATAQDTASNGVLAAASFLLLLVVGCCGSWAFALLARFSYPKALSALADGGRMTLANLLPSVGILAFLAWLPLLAKAAPAWFVYLAPLTLHKAASLSLDFAPDALELITLNGTWAAERTPERAPLRCGIQSIGSMRGIPGHAHNPAVALCHADTTETTGEAWGFAFVYSGNYLIEVERADAGERLVMGIHPYHFHWTLAPGESFTAPEAAMVYSDQGLGEMSRRFHTAIRTRLLPPRWQDMTAPRPVLINSWEACYFDFDEKKLLELAQAAKQADIDLFVLDGGWFKGRNDTSSSLGDWVADTRKLPDGLPSLCKKLNLLGLEMGLWVEPEAISPNSDLYRAHPDWAFAIPGRTPLEVRQQYTLDFSRPEVVDGIWQQLDTILESCPLKYLKWDMNRSLAHVYNAKLPAKRQGEVYHRYVMGVYELQRRLTEKYPGLLLENCAGGGARFDCGMLYYSPQIWCSDNTDARSRLVIQYGTSLFYPGCVMGAHFSTVPNHCTGHISTPEARMAAALTGTFGFELDLTKYTEEELAALRPYVAWYRKHGALLRGGELHRLVDPEPNGLGAAWMLSAKDGSEAAVFAVGDALSGAHGFASPNSRTRTLWEALV